MPDVEVVVIMWLFRRSKLNAKDMPVGVEGVCEYIISVFVTICSHAVIRQSNYLAKTSKLICLGHEGVSLMSLWNLKSAKEHVDSFEESK